MDRPWHQPMTRDEAEAALAVAQDCSPRMGWRMVPICPRNKVRRDPPERGRVRMDRLAGWQVTNEAGDCWRDRATFEILSRQRAEEDYAEAEDAGVGDEWFLVPIHKGDIENPSFIS